MNFAAMQPIKLWVDDLVLNANNSYQPEEQQRQLPRVQLGVSVEEGIHPDGVPIFRCRLDSQVAPANPAHPLPYSAQVKVTGIFGFVKEAELEEKAMRRLVAFNGVAMLYGFARDVIMQHTALGPHGQFMLPALDLAQTADDLVQKMQLSKEGNDDANG